MPLPTSSCTAAVADVADILASVLGCRHPSAEDKLSDIGLTPSFADTLATQLQRTLKLNVEAGDLLAGITVADLAAMCTHAGKRTGFLFSGLGSVCENMGMDLYETSPVARNVWDSADSYWNRQYGFSILSIVRANLSEVTIDFSGVNGKTILANFLKLVEVADVYGYGDTLLPGLSITSLSYVFKSADGGSLLFDPLFMRCLLPVHEKAVYEDLCGQDLVPAKSLFAGHSDGAFGIAFSLVSPVSFSLLECLFFRALVERNCTVPRNSTGETNYGMVVTGPDRVGPHFSIDLLSRVVTLVQSTTNRTAEVVNYNVAEKQYVVAGDGASLETLRTVLMKLRNGDHNIDDTVRSAWDNTLARAHTLGGIDNVPVPDRCALMIPLKGIDVPLHSQCLQQVVPLLRRWFEVQLGGDSDTINTLSLQLSGRFLLNGVAAPFQITRNYMKQFQSFTKSPVISKLLSTTSSDIIVDLPGGNTTTTAFLIEVLVQQTATPVQWIETQDSLIKLGVNRFIEIGPAPMLLNMMKVHVLGTQKSALHEAEHLPSLFFAVAGTLAESIIPQLRYAQAINAQQSQLVDSCDAFVWTTAFMRAVDDLDPAQRRPKLIDCLNSAMSDITGNHSFLTDCPLMDQGVTSQHAVAFSAALKHTFGSDLRISPTIIFDHPTIGQMATFIEHSLFGSDIGSTISSSESWVMLNPSNVDIGIVGMSCRFPGSSDSPGAFWDMLVAGKDGVIEVPK
eukprot:gene9074-21744_t